MQASHWIYLLETVDGRTKVGMTAAPKTRLATHRANFGEFKWCHLLCSGSKTFVAKAERRIIEQLRAVGERVRRTETFLGLDRAKTIAIARAAVKQVRDDSAEAAGLEFSGSAYAHESNFNAHVDAHRLHCIARGVDLFSIRHRAKDESWLEVVEGAAKFWAKRKVA